MQTRLGNAHGGYHVKVEERRALQGDGLLIVFYPRDGRVRPWSVDVGDDSGLDVDLLATE